MAAAISSPQTALFAVIQCNHCKNQLQRPHTLEQCLHSFCKTCLDEIPKKTKNGETGWFCPACSAFSTEEEMRQNSFIEDLKVISLEDGGDDKKEQVKCKQCPKKEKEASSRCNDCKIELCDDCKESHLQIPILKDHKIIGISVETDAMIDKLIFCSAHQHKPVEFNCTTCEVLVCQVCIISDHHEHAIESMDSALDRLLPEMESNSEAIKLNMEAMEVHIQAIKKETEKTKESYASYRLELDERFEAVVNRLKATKDTMEDEITEQETIALDILDTIISNLENQLTLGKNLTNLVEVTTSKTRHTSLLSEMQNGLYSRVNKRFNCQMDSIDFKIKVPEFQNDLNLDGKVTILQDLLGELTYDEPQCNIDSQGQLWTANGFKSLFLETHTRDQVLDLGTTWCNRLSYIDNKIWIPISADNEIQIYNTSGNLVASIETDEDVVVVKKVFNGDIIAGGSTGLFVTNNNFSEWIELASGSFSDICVHDKKFSVLDVEAEKVMTYVLKVESTSATMTWVEEMSFTVSLGFKFGINNSILINSASHYLICVHNHIYEFSDKGDHISSYPMNRWVSTLCGVDRNGMLLVADFKKGGLYLTKNVEDLAQSNLQTLFCNKHIKGEKLRDVVVDRDGDIWYLEGETDRFRLVKYKHQ